MHAITPFTARDREPLLISHMLESSTDEPAHGENGMNLHFFQRRSLKTRVTLFTLSIFVVGIWLLALVATRMLHEDMETLSSEQQFSTATFVAAEINQEIEARRNALISVAQGIPPALLQNPAQLESYLQQTRSFNPCLMVALLWSMSRLRRLSPP